MDAGIKLSNIEGDGDREKRLEELNEKLSVAFKNFEGTIEKFGKAVSKDEKAAERGKEYGEKWEELFQAMQKISEGEFSGKAFQRAKDTSAKAKTKNKPIHQRGSGRQLTYGGKIFNMAQLPFIGPADAKHVFVKYFDYTCGSCRNMEEDLDKLMEKHPGKFAVILLPTPLNRKCNSTLKPKIKDHPWACELAKLGLAAWRAQPESFPEVHKRLFSRPILTVEEARREISRIIPKEKLSQSLKDPWINDLIKANTEDSQTLSAQSVVMPKLLIVDTKVFQGVAKSSDIFVSAMEKLFGL
jgi:hypothetical protein